MIQERIQYRLDTIDDIEDFLMECEQKGYLSHARRTHPSVYFARNRLSFKRRLRREEVEYFVGSIINNSSFQIKWIFPGEPTDALKPYRYARQLDQVSL